MKEEEYKLIFVRDKDGEKLGFFGFYWNDTDFDRQYAYAKKTFAEVRTVKGRVPALGEDVSSSTTP